MAKPENEKKRGIPGRFRWIILLIIVGNVLAVNAFSPVISPHISVSAEPVFGPLELPVLGSLYITNTLIATFIADLILLLLAFSVRRAARRETLFMSGIPGVVATLVEGLYSMAESTAGKWAKSIFPWMATIFLLVLTVNYVELFPGVETIGLLHEPHGAAAYQTEEVFSVGDFTLRTITEEVHLEETGDVHPEEGGAHAGGSAEVAGFTGFVKPASSDLNFTIALALISVVTTQVIGLRALGPGYLKKFFDFGPFIKIWGRQKLGPFDVIMPMIGIFVGILELIAEFAKILSFSFRLFGNIFAGGVLLIIIGSLIPVFAYSGVLFLELFVGGVQAFVFAMLTLVFMSMATHSHGDHEEEHEPA